VVQLVEQPAQRAVEQVRLLGALALEPGPELLLGRAGGHLGPELKLG
jgi:hypothetical protein